MLSKAAWKAIFILPFNVLISIPVLLIYIFEEFSFCKSISACLVALIFFVVGINLLVSTIKLFDKKGKGTLAPWAPTKKLVIAGAYKYVRNPMISGVICILISEALIFNAFSILVEALLIFIINTIYFKLKEEPDLEKRFGSEYVEYKKNVPMWIPKSKPYLNTVTKS